MFNILCLYLLNITQIKNTNYTYIILAYDQYISCISNYKLRVKLLISLFTQNNTDIAVLQW